MKKRKNPRPSSLFKFDGLDCEIMVLLVHNQPLGVLELAEKLGLEHNILKRHLDKLENAKLIIREPVPKSRKILIKLGKQYTPDVVKSLINILGDIEKHQKK